MKKGKSKKYRKQRKKELANRKAKKQATTQPECEKKQAQTGYINIPKPEDKPISPARRAFEGL